MDTSWLTGTELFQGIPAAELPGLLACLGASTRRCRRGETVCRPGDVLPALGVVLSGGVNVENYDFWGSRAILGHAGPGEIFGEAYACLPGERMLVGVAAAEETELLFLRTERLLHPCETVCPRHTAIIRNLLAVTARKNIRLTGKIFHTAPKTIRGRVLAYLSDQARRTGRAQFDVPFDRQQLADYLQVDRSALSAELGRMRRDGLIDFYRSTFRLLASDGAAQKT